MTVQTAYQKAILFAAAKHQEEEQTLPGTNLPYVVHLSNVAMEILIAGHATGTLDLPFAIQVALLHDVLEDTATTAGELTSQFSIAVATAVAALTKNNALPKSEKMQDSLNRIRSCSKEVWAVKLADRITNLQEPPSSWSKAKRLDYVAEAHTILSFLAGANEYLEARLQQKIHDYEQNYCG
ncbi:HD domain-containing protein [Nibrella saemangeumensis]|uniref:HD domain-containing protein n=1 Tax=Nibrella saemangeumensis TaxID=1084526 RepID=A0ABP8NIX9_9BACT